jgi:hypothetical protein
MISSLVTIDGRGYLMVDWIPISGKTALFPVETEGAGCALSAVHGWHAPLLVVGGARMDCDERIALSLERRNKL